MPHFTKEVRLEQEDRELEMVQSVELENQVDHDTGPGTFKALLVDIQTDRVSLCLSAAFLRARAQCMFSQNDPK